LDGFELGAAELGMHRHTQQARRQIRARRLHARAGAGLRRRELVEPLDQPIDVERRVGISHHLSRQPVR